MSLRCHASLEGAQHGDKSLDGLVKFAEISGCHGLQPSNYHLQTADGGLLSAKVIKAFFAQCRLDGVSAHCPFWVHGTAWTGSKTIRPFIPPEVAAMSTDKIESWAESYCLRLLDLCAELGVKVVPMFWGTLFGWELATGYPWGFYAGGSGDLAYDLVKEGQERFVNKTGKLRDHARSLGISLSHEIHPGTAAMTADDFLMLVQICGGDTCLGVNADPSHCWEGESWETRFTKVGKYVTGCHVKDHVIREGMPLRSMLGGWKQRAMQFCRLGDGQIDLVRYVQLMDDVGYVDRYCRAHGTTTAPLVGEAESAYFELDHASSHASAYIAQTLCAPFATRSFEDGMGD